MAQSRSCVACRVEFVGPIRKGCCRTCYDKLRYYAAPAESRARVQAYRDRDRQAVRALERARYHANVDKSREKARAWRAKDPQKHRDCVKRSGLNSPTYVARHRAAAARRKALKRGARELRFTAAQWDAMKARYGGRCRYCECAPEKLTQDHRIPISRGGQHVEANIVPACASCNSRKHTKTEAEFLAIPVPHTKATESVSLRD